MGKIIIITGPSGVGKTTLSKFLLQSSEKFEKPITATTRSIRENEVDGKDYFFLSVEDFKNKITEKYFIENEEVYPGKFYGVPISELERILEEGKIPVLVVDVMGAQTIAAMYGRNTYVVNVAYPSIEEAYDRLQKRDNTVDPERFNKIRQEENMGEIIQSVKIVNDKLDVAVRELIRNVHTFTFLRETI